MKYFDALAALIEEELQKRGVITDDLKYCVKADLDGEGRYIDVYVTFTDKVLSIISGYEHYEKLKRREKRKCMSRFDVSGYEEYELESIERMYVDRYADTARLMIEPKDGEDFPIARFSLGFADKFEKFCERVNKTVKGEPIDDTLLEGVKTHCLICGERYPDPNRPVCPRCVDRRSVFIRLLKIFGEFKWAVIMILLTIVLSNVFAVLTPIFGAQMFYDEVQGALLPDGNPATLLIDDDFQGGELQGWQIEVDEVLDEAQPVANADSTSYVEWHQSGAVTALHVKATSPEGSRSVSGWITTGSYMFPYQLLPVTQHQSIVMAEREPQRYLSKVEIMTESGKHEEADILVNQPYSIGGWKIYQLNYDTSRGKWSEISVLELVRDPWLPSVYIGIYLMIAGAVLLLFTAKKGFGSKDNNGQSSIVNSQSSIVNSQSSIVNCSNDVE